MEPKNILFISYDGMTDPLGQSQVIPYLQGLSRYGYNIYLLSCEKKAPYGQHKEMISDLLAASNIRWTPLKYTKKPPMLSTYKDILQLKAAAKKIHRAHGIDMVHTRPGIPSMVGLWMKKKFGVKFLNDIREFYADSRVDGRMWNLANPLYNRVYKFFKKQEAREVAQSDGIVCLTYAAEKIIRQWPEYKKGTPLEVIPCSADLELFDPTRISEERKAILREELGIKPGDFIVSYLGSIGGWYLTAEMLQCCKAISDNIPAAKFLFISPHRHEDILTEARRYNIPAQQVITRRAKRTEVPELLSLSSFSIFFIRPCYSKQSSSPTKHGEIMAMGIPLITNNGVGDVEHIVVKYDSGIVISDFSEKAYTAATEALKQPEAYDPARIREGAKEFYALPAAIAKYIKIYDSILQS